MTKNVHSEKTTINRVVVVGGVAGGMTAATRLRRLDDELEIIVLEKSGHVSYSNCGLPYFIGGIVADEKVLLPHDPETLKERYGLDVRINCEVVHIDPALKIITTLDTKTNATSEIAYDKLIISVGANPIVPALPGIERAMALRTVEDAEKIFRSVGMQPKSAAIIGGGFIGVEIAENLIARGIATSMIELSTQVLAPLDPEMATEVAHELIRNGVSLYLQEEVATITGSEIICVSGKKIAAEIIILAIGVVPDTKLALSAGLDIGPRGGIAVNDFNQTSDSNIYAIGDAAEKSDFISGEPTLIALAGPASHEGRNVAGHILGEKVRATKNMGTAVVKVFDLTIAVTGWNEKRLTKAEIVHSIIHTHSTSNADYYPTFEKMAFKLLFDATDGRILGGQGVGKAGIDKRIDVIATAMRGKLTAPELSDLELGYAPQYGSSKDPVNMLGYIAENMMRKKFESIQWFEIDEYVARGFALIDIRGADLFALGSIPGAANMEFNELRDLKTNSITSGFLIYCEEGERSEAGAALLKNLGLTAVSLDGGYETWKVSPHSILQQNFE